jgi:hypothetical protein
VMKRMITFLTLKCHKCYLGGSTAAADEMEAGCLATFFTTGILGSGLSHV